MKAIVPIFLMSLLASCQYDNITPSATGNNASINSSDLVNTQTAASQVSGKWIVVKDSLEWGGPGVSHKQTDSDYYDFTDSGIVLIKEGATLDSARFSLADGQLALLFNGPTILSTDTNVSQTISGTQIDRISGTYATTFSPGTMTLRISYRYRPPVIAPPYTYPTFTAVISLRKAS